MEPNIPVVGGEEPTPQESSSAAPQGEATNGVTHDVEVTTPPASQQESAPAESSPPMDSGEQPATPVSDSETPVSESSEAPVSDMQTLLDQHQDESQVKKGDILEGVIAQTSPTAILIDLGLKSEGVITGKELERIDRETLQTLKEGEKVLVFVLSAEDRNGNIALSLTRALEEQDWRKAEELHQSGGVYSGKVDGYNKGGLIVRFGRVRGFVPESQVSRDRRRRAEGADPQEKWGTMRGENIAVKVLEVDRGRNRLILSEREAAPQMREQQKEKLMDELQVGDVKTGRVKSLADFGAFVDVGGADGLVHLTELSWKHITHPREVLHVGQEVEVEIISVDRERKRIGLSIRRREEDPWVVIARQYQIGQLVQGTITKLTKFGAFARLVDNPEIEGLIHISELADHRVNHPRDVVNENDVLTLRVVKIESDQRRMGLSLKKVSSPEFMDQDYKRATTAPAPAVSEIADYEAATLKEEDRRRNDRKKGKKGKKGGKGGEFEEFEDDEYGEEEY